MAGTSRIILERSRGVIIEEAIPGALDGERLDRIVALMLDVSRSDAASVIESGGVTVDAAPTQIGKQRLAKGQMVRVDDSFLPSPLLPLPDDSLEIDVVHADDDVIVVNKSAGMVVHPAAGHQGGTLVNALLARFPEISDVGEPIRPGVVHRLDAGTSGLLMVARSRLAYEHLVAQLAERSVEREYVALAWGHFDSVTSTIDAPLGRDHRDPMRMAVVHDGKMARTHIEVLQGFVEPAAVSLVKCNLETGRTHQIRVHLAAVSHPVVGDATYGGARSSLPAPRPMLHARRLGFVHPSTGVSMAFETPIPKDMAGVIARCS